MSDQEAVADIQRLRGLATGEQQMAPTQDHPQLEDFLKGRVAPNPIQTQQLSQQMTPDTRRHLQHIVDAGENYGQIMTSERDADGNRVWKDDPDAKAYQARAKQLLNQGGTHMLRKDVEKQKAEKAADEAKTQKDLEMHTKRAEDIRKLHPQLTHEEAMAIAQGKGSTEGLEHAYTYKDFHGELKDAATEARTYVDKQLAENYHKPLKDYEDEARRVRLKNAAVRNRDEQEPEPGKPGMVGQWQPWNRDMLIQQEMQRQRQARDLGTGDYNSYIQNKRQSHQSNEGMRRLAGERERLGYPQPPGQPQQAPQQPGAPAPAPAAPQRPQAPAPVPIDPAQQKANQQAVSDLHSKLSAVGRAGKLTSPNDRDAVNDLQRLLLKSGGQFMSLPAEDRFVLEQAWARVRKFLPDEMPESANLHGIEPKVKPKWLQ